jgi:hypothetical protein
VATAAAGTAPDSSAGGSTKQTTQGGASTAGGDDAGASRHVAQQVTHTEPAARGLTGDGGESEAGDWVYDVYLVADSTAGAPGQPCGPDAPIQLGRQHPGAASGGGTAEGESSGGEAMEVGGGEDPWAELPVVEVGASMGEWSVLCVPLHCSEGSNDGGCHCLAANVSHIHTVETTACELGQQRKPVLHW